MTAYVHDHSHMQVTRNVNVTDGQIRPQPYSLAGRTYRVEYVVITYSYVAWGWATKGIQMSGTVLRKDGSDSKNDARESIYNSEGAPEWLAGLIDGIRPVGVPVLPMGVFQDPDDS